MKPEKVVGVDRYGEVEKEKVTSGRRIVWGVSASDVGCLRGGWCRSTRRAVWTVDV
jgi:hypothetical protein